LGQAGQFPGGNRPAQPSLPSYALNARSFVEVILRVNALAALCRPLVSPQISRVHRADWRAQSTASQAWGGRLACDRLALTQTPNMEDASKSSSIIRFGAYEANLAAGELRKNGSKIKLQERPFEILAILLERPGEMVSREQLREHLWPADTFVDFDHGLNNAVNKLRYALDDSADNPRFVETVGRRGYRFIAPVERPIQTVRAHEASPENAAAARPARPSRRVWIAGLAALAIVLLVIAGWNAGWWGQRLRQEAGAAHIQSVAVLPLDNLSGNPAEEYFADGMTDELITELAKIGSLRVISRTSVMHYRGTKKTLPQIGRELNVNAVVEGSVMRSGDHVRINAQLILVATDHHLWAKSFERDLRDVLAIQGEVAQAIATEVQIKLTPQERAHFSATRPVNPEAYEAYLKGHYYSDKGTEVEVRKGIEYLNAALRIDPSYAPAWAGMADSYYNLSNVYLPPAEAMPKARAAAEKALAIDETLASAHTALGLVRLYYDRDLPAAEREFRRAIELGPNDAQAHLWYGTYCALMGRREESLPHLKLAQQLDPLSPETSTYVGFALYLLREYAQVVVQSLESLKVDPNNWGAHADLGMGYQQMGRFTEAVAEFHQASELSGSPPLLAELGHAYAVAGKKAEAQKVLGDLMELSKRRFVPAFGIAIIHVGLGHREQALHWLEKAYEDRSEDFVSLRADPQFDPLRSDPRFANLLRRVGLPP
jgi:TolB-like protein/DNA-binding winged helix-turn-helix (wHTH) protein/Flp pilus assembly protein TadD